MQMSDEDEDITAKEEIALLVAQRITELRESPVKGIFDIAHLQEVHRRIFQDCPELPHVEAQKYKPGELRPPVPGSQDWVKERTLESINNVSHPVYSSMDNKAVQQLVDVLNAVSVSQLAKRSEDDFKKSICELYVNIDYIHPFSEGNSRTLREFTAQLAKEAGYKIAWDRFNTEHGRDVLYIARDLSVNRVAMPQIRDHNARMWANTTLYVFGQNKDLAALLPEVIQKLEKHEQEKTR